MEPPEDVAVLAYDGECGFCKRWIERWRVELGERVEMRPWQELVRERPELASDEFGRSIHLFERDGRVFRGAHAVLRALAHEPRKRWMLWSYENVFGWRAAAELVYRFVAKHRTLASRISDVLYGRDLTPVAHDAMRRVFTTLLGVVYLAAFVSLERQVDALIGSGGIAPAAGFLDRVREQLGGSAWSKLPTVLWWSSTDTAIRVLCFAGIAAAVMLMIGLAPRIAAGVAWVAYLSFVSVGDVFLGYQWDALLLETGLLAIVFAPGTLGIAWRSARPPSRWMIWLLRWLLFRVVFTSGYVKLASHDPTWADRTALEYHYWTQPLPHTLAWFTAQLPAAFHRFSVWLMFAIELGLVWLVFAPRRMRFVAAAAIVALMLLISATGNYGFFTLLTTALCVTLLDDRALRSWIPERWRSQRDRVRRARTSSTWRTVAMTAFAACVLAITGCITALRMRLIESMPSSLRTAVVAAAPFECFNSYGLFAVMTTTRPEIIIEGSDDGVEWRAYEFRWKPGKLDRSPGFAWVHMPRIDWQMWFAALGTWRDNAWYLHFVQRLLEGSPAVFAQLAHNPSPDHPPRYIRSTVYRYTFTTREEHAAAHAWWKRELVGEYCPTLQLVDGRLAPVAR